MLPNDITRMFNFIDESCISRYRNLVERIAISSTFDISCYKDIDSMANILYMCNKWGIDFHTYDSYEIGTTAVVFIYGTYVLKVTCDLIQCMDSTALVGESSAHTIHVYDVCSNVVLLERANLEPVHEYVHYDIIVRKLVNEERDVDIQLVKDCIKCFKYYQSRFDIDWIDASLRNIGMNMHGNFVVFDW